jgi:hypothetical protein
MEPQPVRERAIKASKKARKAGRRRNFVEFISEVYWILNLGGIKISKLNALKID